MQAAKFFNELHTYMPATSRWECIVTTSSPPPMAGQGASVIGDSMIVYGGCVGQSLGYIGWLNNLLRANRILLFTSLYSYLQF